MGRKRNGRKWRLEGHGGSLLTPLHVSAYPQWRSWGVRGSDSVCSSGVPQPPKIEAGYSKVSRLHRSSGV